MSVAYQSSGSVAQTGNTWSYTNPAGSNCIVIAIQSGTSATDTISAVTYGGVSIPLIGWQNSDNGSSGGVALYGLVSGSLPTGANNIVATGYSGFWLGAASYSGAGSFGTAVKAYGATTGSGTTATLTGTTTGGMCVAASSFGGAAGGGTETATSGTLRWQQNLDNGGGANNGWYIDKASAGGGGSTSLSWTTSAGDDWWGTVAVEILSPSGTPVSSADVARAAEAAYGFGGDWAHAAESGSVTTGGIPVSSADTGHAAESASVHVALPGADSVSAAEAASLRVTLSGSDSSSAAETGAATPAGEHPVSSADAVHAVESAFYYHLNADTPHGAEGAAQIAVSAADSAFAADAPMNAWPGSSDALSAAEAPVNAWPASADTASAAEAWAPFGFTLADSSSAAGVVHEIGIWTYIETGVRLLAPEPYRHDPVAAARRQAAVARLAAAGTWVRLAARPGILEHSGAGQARTGSEGPDPEA